MQASSTDSAMLLFLSVLLLILMLLFFITLLAGWYRAEQTRMEFISLEKEIRVKFEKLPSSDDLNEFFQDSLKNLQNSVESKITASLKDVILPVFSNKVSEVRDQISAVMINTFKSVLLPRLGQKGLQNTRQKVQEMRESNPVVNLVYDELSPNHKKIVRNNNPNEKIQK